MAVPSRPKQYVRLTDAADILGCTDRTVRRMIERGELTAYRVNGLRSIRIDVEEIERLVHPESAKAAE